MNVIKVYFVGIYPPKMQTTKLETPIMKLETIGKASKGLLKTNIKWDHENKKAQAGVSRQQCG